MPNPRVQVTVDADTVHRGMERLRTELQITVEHPPDARAEARAASTSTAWRHERADRTAVDLVTIDPPGSRDLDQAFGAERRSAGYRIWYAIADVAAFVAPGGALDAECHRRGVTLYGPDVRAPLHPPVLSEGAASLLPDGERPALLWCIDLDADGEPVTTRLERAIVRSRAQLTYAEVDRALTNGTAPEPLALLREVGTLRQARERDRGGVSLPIPDQIVAADGGRYHLVYDAPRPSEGWNAQISLLTGMEAARIMLAGGAGLLRTLDPPDPDELDHLRTAAAALGVSCPRDCSYGELVRSLDPASPEGAALLVQATRVLRGAGYRGFRDGDVPDLHVHSAVAAPYAHVTAPLRRLCDRAANEVVLAHVDGRPVPDWAASELDVLPATMADARRRDGAYTRATLDLVESLVLRPWAGHTFDAVVVDVDDRGDDPHPRRAQVQLREPAVVAWARAGRVVEPGAEVSVILHSADPVERRVDLEVR